MANIPDAYAPAFHRGDVVTVHDLDVPVVGGRGVVLAHSEPEDGGWEYAVALDDDDEMVWCISGSRLRPTGDKRRVDEIMVERGEGFDV